MPILSKFLYESKITKQFMCNWLQLGKIFSQFYRYELKAVKEDAAVMSFTFTLSRFLTCKLPDQKYITNEHKQAQSWCWKSQNSKVVLPWSHHCILSASSGWSKNDRCNGLVVKALDSQSRGPGPKPTGWFQGRLSISSSRGW